MAKLISKMRTIVCFMEDMKNDEECPWCGSPEIESSSPRTTYSCGSSCYDQRDGTWQQSALCRKREKAWRDNADNL
jgi:hypothetical protein